MKVASAAAVCISAPLYAQSRSDENAVTQAEDAFGFSVGRESLGIYNAGNARGSFFRPEVDDEVVVGFLNDDPRSPIILGCLHSSSLAAPLTPSADNYQKGFFTRENIQLLFDDEKKSVTIKTPGDNSIVIDDDAKSIILKDQNNNKIEMSDKGVIIESGADISLKASSGDIKIEGMNITLSADSQFKAEGSAGAEVSTSANAVIKGSIVQIN